MTRMTVRFKDAEDVVEFVNVISRCSCDVDLKYGSRIVDAKSIMGVFLLMNAGELELIFHTEEFSCDSYKELLSSFAA